MVLVQKGPFFQIFIFSGNIGQQNVFYDILERKNALTIFQNKKTPFQAGTTRSSKSRKIDIFPKGLTRGFGSKTAIFTSFFSDNMGQENVFYDILEQKNALTIFQNKKTPFLAGTTRSSKSQKIDIFPKGLTHGFGSKMPIFPIFLFRQYRPGKCLL